MKKPDEETFQFEELLAQKLHSLYTKAHAREIGRDTYVNDDEYFSVDGFYIQGASLLPTGKNFSSTF
ncbi:hypothetical protein FKG94_20875 [Exilibacterium tricleocarpae]|uniref:Uncharacterized protein n=1 Tax=Exilibacterium tricleocarpae TaxID=2591008 RepID=A0A545T0N3_9GAMM|nr:hypothetical protein [Exilibacterium tricleocarpae]TQV70783.1 hypothetical protein FKG94_20875 [Exilibacterium tricleocarpae]